MIERSEDGSLHPIVMDFGLARESSESRGLTESGAVMGTPAYMAPEQARGETRLIDRRSDVYSLGATLYDLIVGTPPFDAPSVMDILLQVISDDVRPLRAAVPSVPPDLETIVMKCLNKEPNQRYDSAKALADDLSRYINGEPILGRRVSLAYRLRRWTRRHRTVVAVGAVSAVLLLGLLGSSIRQTIANQRERKRVAAQAALEQELTQQIKDMEWFLRTAYQLPLHDIEEEQKIVRQRMAALPQPSPALGERGIGMVHCARGRGHLALHETALALGELRQAQQKGVDTPELHYALGRALGDLYNQAMEEARRQGDKLWLEGRQKELEAQYLKPALAELERSRGLQLESPEYLDGLIAFYRKQYDVAQDKARQAQSRARWWYEARQLEGDVLLERGVDQKNHGQYDLATTNLQSAIGAYLNAAEIGRSDASIYESIAEAYIQQTEIARNSRKPQNELLMKALDSADKAILSDPQRASGYTKKAYTRFWMAWEKLFSGEDPHPEVQNLIDAAQQAITHNANDAYAYDAMGNGYYCLASFEIDNGADPIESLTKGTLALQAAIARAPNFPWALNDLALMLAAKGRYLYEHGGELSPDCIKGISLLMRAVELAPDFANGYANMTMLYALLAQVQLDSGKNPSSYVNAAFKASEKCMLINKNFNNFQDLAKLRIFNAEYLAATGKNPTEEASKAQLIVDKLQKIDPNDLSSFQSQARISLILAKYFMNSDTDPTPSLERGIQSAENCLKRNPNVSECWVAKSDLELVATEWALKQKRTAQPAVEAAVDAAQHAVRTGPNDADPARSLAKADLMSAKLTKRQASARLTEGLSQIERALKINANRATSYAIRASLLLLQGQRAQEPSQRRVLFHEAEAGFKQAVQMNHLLKFQYEKELQEFAAEENVDLKVETREAQTQ